MKKLFVLLAGLMVIMLSSTGMSYAQLDKNLEAAMKAAVKGPTKEFIKVFGHDFRVYKASLKKAGNQVIINGQLHHQITLRPDDKVYYTIILKGKDIAPEIKYRIAQGGLMPIAAPLISAAGAYFTGKTVPPDQIKKAGTDAAKLVTGRGWEQAAELIIFNVALSFQSQQGE